MCVFFFLFFVELKIAGQRHFFVQNMVLLYFGVKVIILCGLPSCNICVVGNGPSSWLSPSRALRFLISCLCSSIKSMSAGTTMRVYRYESWPGKGNLAILLSLFTLSANRLLPSSEAS